VYRVYILCRVIYITNQCHITANCEIETRLKWENGHVRKGGMRRETGNGSNNVTEDHHLPCKQLDKKDENYWEMCHSLITSSFNFESVILNF
jgi:hypothetical protein